MIGRKVALVLGAGGPVGHAFHAGVLAAAEEHAGWDARGSSLIVGTSAGASVGALLRAGMAGRDLYARVAREPMSDEGAAIARHYVRAAIGEGPRATPYTPAALEYLRRVAREPRSLRPGPLVAALLPEGTTCLKDQAARLGNLFGGEWPSLPLWLTAADLGTGERVAFGRSGAPRTDVGTAVSCSGAVPGLCRPVSVGDRRYVDGGILSATHLDLVDDRYDLVVVSSPLSMFAPMRWLLRRELSHARARGLTTLAIEPDAAAMRVMGNDPMDASRGPDVARAALRLMADVLARSGDVPRRDS